MGNTQSEIANDDDTAQERAPRPEKRQRTGSPGEGEFFESNGRETRTAVRAKASTKSAKTSRKLAQERQNWQNQMNAAAYPNRGLSSSETASDRKPSTDTANPHKRISSTSLKASNATDRRHATPPTRNPRSLPFVYQPPPTETQTSNLSGNQPPTGIGKGKRGAEDHDELVYLAGNRTKSTGFPSSGQISNDELKAIGSSASLFMQENGLTKVELYELIQENPQKSTMHSAFWATILETLPNRANSEGRIPTTQRGNIMKVVRRTMNKYAAFGNKWDAEMEQLLWSTVQEDMAKEGRPKWQSYQEMFQRYHEHIRDHYRWMQKSSMGAWTAAEEAKFLGLITDAVSKLKAAQKPSSQAETLVRNSQGGILPDEFFDYESQINFKTIAQQMSTRNDLQCRNKFRIIKANRMKDRTFEQTRAALKYEGGSTREMQAIDHYNRMKTGDIYSIIKDVHSHLAAKKGRMECDIRWLEVHKHATVGTWMLLDRKVAFQRTMEDMVPGCVPHQTNTLTTLEEIMRYFRKKKVKELGEFYDVATQGPLPRTWTSNKRMDKAKSAAVVVESSGESSADETSSFKQKSAPTKNPFSAKRSSAAKGSSASNPLAVRLSTETSSTTSSSSDTSSTDDSLDDNSSNNSSDSTSSDGDSSSDET